MALACRNEDSMESLYKKLVASAGSDAAERILKIKVDATQPGIPPRWRGRRSRGWCRIEWGSASFGRQGIRPLTCLASDVMT